MSETNLWYEEELAESRAEARAMEKLSMKHELVNGTLTVEADGIAARCVCGWASAGHFTSLAASAAMQAHVDEQEGLRPASFVTEQ